jgi:uncharacterized membrane protein
LVLPKTLSLDGAAHQDGLIISCLALTFAFVTVPGRMSFAQKLVSSAIIGAAIAAKPTFAPLLLIFSFPQFGGAREHRPYLENVGWCMLALGVAGVWIIFGFIPAKVALKPDASAIDQLRFLISSPSHVFDIAVQTLQTNFPSYAKRFVAAIGWGDTTHFSIVTYWFYWCFLAAAIAGDYFSGGNTVPVTARLVTSVAILVCLGAIFLALYLFYTTVGYPEVRGIQGRYFIPVALFLPIVFTPQRVSTISETLWFRRLYEIFPFLSAYGFWVLPRALMLRYWG